jgi:hypothetical protein
VGDGHATGPGRLDDVVDRLLHRGDLFGVLVGDLGLELLLERHDELDRIQRVGPQIVYEGGVIGDFLFLHTELLGDDLLHPFFDCAHLGNCPVSSWVTRRHGSRKRGAILSKPASGR